MLALTLCGSVQIIYEMDFEKRLKNSEQDPILVSDYNFRITVVSGHYWTGKTLNFENACVVNNKNDSAIPATEVMDGWEGLPLVVNTRIKLEWSAQQW